MKKYAEAAPIAINFTVDVDQGITVKPKSLTIQQGEHNARYFQVSLVHNEMPVNLANSEVHFLTQPHKSDEIPTTTNCEIYDAENGQVMVAVKDYMSNKSGIINGEFVRIGEDGSSLPFKNFTISVDGSIFVNDGLGQSEPLHSLVSALARVQRVEEYLEQEFMDVEAKYAGELSKTNAQLSDMTPKVLESIEKSNDALAKANNPLGSLQNNGLKIPHSMLDDETIKAITGTTTITTNAGYEKNKGVDYPLKQVTRNGIISQTDEKIKNGILDIKVLGAKYDKYYRLEWLGNGVELLGENRYDVLLSEYDKETYNSNSVSNDLITLNDNLGLNNGYVDGNIVTKTFTSPRENVSIQITYDSNIIGDSMALNNELGSGYSFVIDESCYVMSQDEILQKTPSMYLKKDGDHLVFSWKYSSSKDIHVHINRFSANKLMLIGKIAFVENSNQFVSKDFSKIEEEFTPELTDWISPYIMKAINNPDGDKMDSEYEFVGGCHNYNNGADEASSATARLVNYQLIVDGKIVTNDGIYGCDKVELKCVNRVQGNNTKKVDGRGREILEENVTYEVTYGSILVSNRMTALEEIVIDRNYGLQAYLWGFALNNGKMLYVDGVGYNKYDITSSNSHNSGGKNNGDLCQKVIITSENDVMEVNLHKVGLGNKREINDTDHLAFYTNNKVYFHLINKYLTLSTGNSLFYEGYYKFYPNLGTIG